ncbi:MAG: S41 family peptidase [Anaerolineaceae bacterium]|nr:S41 family peptidase [Anaerolineaceae bacterium]
MTGLQTSKQQTIIGKVLQVVWIGFNFVAGALGGAVLAYGPLEAGWTVVALFALAGGGLMGYAWLRQVSFARRGDALMAKKLRNRLLIAQLAVLLIVGGIALWQLTAQGMFKPLRSDYDTAFERLWNAVDQSYPYFDEKGIDWKAVYAEYQPRAAEAQSDEVFFTVIAEMMAELHDAHTGLSQPMLEYQRRFFGFGIALDDGYVIGEIGKIGRDLGLERGMRLIAIDGVPVEEALYALPSYLWAASTPGQERLFGAEFLLSMSNDTPEMSVTYEDFDGVEHTVMLVYPTTPPTAQQTQNNVVDNSPVVYGERLPEGYGYIKIPTFGSRAGHDLVAEFDAALDDLMDTPGLIIDLRGNGGGNSIYADQMAGRFFEAWFTYGTDTFGSRMPLRAWRRHWSYLIRPRGAQYTQPVVILTDGQVMSSAELFAAAMVDTQRAVTIGRPTGGSSGNPTGFNLPNGGKVRFSTADFQRMDGQSIEGIGIEPTARVPYTVADFQAGIDVDLIAAVEYLRTH